jgi:hypothetical protein
MQGSAPAASVPPAPRPAAPAAPARPPPRPPAPRPPAPAAGSPIAPPSGAKKGRGALYALAAVIVVILLVLMVGYLYLASRSPSVQTLEGVGVTWQVNAGQYETIRFSLSQAGEITGTVSSTSYMEAYLMTPSEYASFQSNVSHTGATYSSGETESAVFDVDIASGAWALVFIASNPSAAMSVEVTQAIVVTPN